MKSSIINGRYVGNILLSFLLSGQFLSLAAQYFLNIRGIYFAVFLLACFYCSKNIRVRHLFGYAYPLDLLWIAYFVYFFVSAGLFGRTSFHSFFLLFASQAFIPFLLGRTFRFNCSIKQINLCLILILFLYIGILVYLYILDPSIYSADRFIPFMPSSLQEAGGDPSQAFLGYGLAAILLSIYFILRSENSYIKRFLAFEFFLFCLALLILILVGSRATLFAVLVILFANECRGKPTLRNYLFILSSLALVSLLGATVISQERLSFFSELSVLSDLAGQNLLCLDPANGSFLSRVSGILQSINIFSNHLLWGVGVGNYGWFHCGLKGDFIYPHNVIAQIMAEAGLIGLIIFLFCIYLTYNNYIQLLHSPCGNAFKDFHRFFFNFWIFTLVVSLFSSNAYADPLLYLLSGIVSKSFHFYSTHNISSSSICVTESFIRNRRLS